MTDLRTAAQQALEALEEYQSKGAPFMACDGAIDALRAALAQQAEPVQEPVQEPEGLDWRYTARIGYVVKPYTAPPQRQPLTQEEIDRICASLGFAAISPAEIVRAVERAHGIGETK